MNIRLILPALAFVPIYLLARWLDFPAGDMDPTVIPSIAVTFAQVGASMLGFMLAAMAILATISETHLVKTMKQQGYYNDLLKTLFMGCCIFLLLSVLGIVQLLHSNGWQTLRFFFLPICVSALISLLDLGHKFWLVLSNLNKP